MACTRWCMMLHFLCVVVELLNRTLNNGLQTMKSHHGMPCSSRVHLCMCWNDQLCLHALFVENTPHPRVVHSKCSELNREFKHNTQKF